LKKRHQTSPACHFTLKTAESGAVAIRLVVEVPLWAADRVVAARSGFRTENAGYGWVSTSPMALAPTPDRGIPVVPSVPAPLPATSKGYSFSAGADYFITKPPELRTLLKSCGRQPVFLNGAIDERPHDRFSSAPKSLDRQMYIGFRSTGYLQKIILETGKANHPPGHLLTMPSGRKSVCSLPIGFRLIVT